jgi:hypothetical protein
MLRPSDYGLKVGLDRRPGQLPKDQCRGVDPELVDRLEATLDERLGEMFAMVTSGKPVTGRRVGHLILIARLMKGTLEKFEEQCELAL